MEHFAGLDVATATTTICIVDGSGAQILEQIVATDPRTIAQILAPYGQTLRRAGHFEAKVRALIAADPLLAGMIEPMLKVRAVMWEQYGKLHSFLLRIVAADMVCRCVMSVPGVGPVTALAVKSALDDPTRFNRARNVGAYFGLTPRRWPSGSSIDLQGHISKQGDNDVRRYLYEAAHILLTRVQGFSTLKAWGLRLARTKGHARAVTAVARKLAMVLFAMWRDGTGYRWGADPAAKAARPRRKKPAPEVVI